MQIEADKLKEVAVDGTETKIVSIGIIPTEDDHGIDFTEHYSIASAPLDGNVILIDTVEVLQGVVDSVEQRILDASCSGRYSLLWPPYGIFLSCGFLFFLFSFFLEYSQPSQIGWIKVKKTLKFNK